MRLGRSGFSSVLPSRDAAGSLRLFRCDPLPEAALGDVHDALPLVLRLHTGTLLGPWEPVATVTLTEGGSGAAGWPAVRPLAHHHRSSPSACSTALRAPAYAASRAVTDTAAVASGDRPA